MLPRDKFLAITIVLLFLISTWFIFLYDKRPFKLGLDIQGGIHLVVEAQDVPADPENGQKAIKVTADITSSALAVVDQRVNGLGVAEPLIQRKGERQIIVELPGIDDPQEAVKLIGETAKLDFRRKDEKAADKWVKTGIQGKMLKDARANVQSGEWIIQFEFNREGAQLFGDLTTKIVGEPLGIFLDDKLVSAPNVRSPITGGSGYIEGNFTPESAKRLAIQLKAGQLPVPLVMVENRTVGPTLGQQAVEQSFISGLIGFGLILCYMLWWYRIPGALSIIALLLYSAMTLSIYKAIPVTLTVPGLAGFILSIGMAVDANILIFERTKEELRSGKSIFNAVDAGFKRAFSSIFDSNITTLISCGVLFYFGTGMIKGFALTLAIGVIISMFTAITVTRTLMKMVSFSKKMRNPKLYGVKPALRKQKT